MILRKCLLDDSPKGSYPEEKNGKKRGHENSGNTDLAFGPKWDKVPNLRLY